MTDIAAPRLNVLQVWMGPILVLMGGICIGFAPIGVRFGLDALGPQAIAFWRYLFAVPMVLTLVLVAKKRLPARPNKFVFLAGCFFALDIGAWHAALTFTTVANATFLVNLGNIGVGFLAWIFLKDRPSWTWAMAVVIALIGAAFLTLGGSDLAVKDLRGEAFGLAAAALVSFYMLCVKIARRELSGLDVLFWVTLSAAGMGALVTFAAGEAFLPTSMSGFAVPLFLAFVAQMGGQGLIIAGLGKTPASIAGVLVLIQPVVAAAISWQLFNETLVTIQFLGGGLLLGGIILAQQGARAKVDVAVD